MSDDRRRDDPFGGPRRLPSNGAQPPGIDPPTMPIPVIRPAGEEPIDLVAVQADDELIDALAAGMPVSGPGLGGYDADDRVAVMLAAWRADVDAEPIPELVDLDTAVAAVRSTRSRSRRRHLAPLVGAAALVLFAGGGVAAAGVQTAQPGDVFWGVTKVFNSERATSVEAAVEVESRLERVRTALESGETAVAAQELEAVEDDLGVIREEEGRSDYSERQQQLAAKLQETPPGTPTDPDAPLTSAPVSPSPTSAPGAPEGAGSATADPGREQAPSVPPTTTPTIPPSTSTLPATPEGTTGQTTGTAEGSVGPSSTGGRLAPSSDAGTVPQGTPTASGATPTASGSAGPTAPTS